MEIVGCIACFAVGVLAGLFLRRFRHGRGEPPEPPKPQDSETRADVQYQNLFCYDGTANNQQSLE